MAQRRRAVGGEVGTYLWMSHRLQGWLNASRLRSAHAGVALPLVNAFAIPDHILRAPIGLQGAGDGGGMGDGIYKEYLLAAGFDV